MQLKPGSLPGPVNHQIDGVGDEIPDAKEKAQQTSHKPHAEKPKTYFQVDLQNGIVPVQCPTTDERVENARKLSQR